VRRLAGISLLVGYYLFVITQNWLFDALDALFFPRAASTPTPAPVIVIAVPRSGTTFLHGLLAQDRARFRFLTMFDSMFPAVSSRKIYDACAALDRLIGAPVARLVGAIERAAFAGWDGIHATGLMRPEEDECLWCFPMLTPAMWLAFPFTEELRHLRYIDLMPAPVRTALTAFLKRYMSKQAALDPQRRTLLLKNVLLAGRIETVATAFPDARFIYLVRSPHETVASSVSMFSRPWRLHSPDLAYNPAATRAWADLLMDYSDTYDAFVDGLPDERRFVLDYQRLVAKPSEAVAAIYAHFGWEIEADFRQALTAADSRQARFASSHSYSLEACGLTTQEVDQRMARFMTRHGFAPTANQSASAEERIG
jgi:hypothetical protein